MNRRLRGALGTALAWGVGWTAVGLGVGGLRAAALRAAGMQLPMELTRFVAIVTLQWTAFGVVAGALFALALWYAGRRVESIGALSGRRVAVWGALAGVALPLGLVALLAAGGVAVPLATVLMLLVTGGAFGAGSAAGTIAIARRAPASLAAGSDTSVLSPPVA